LPALAKSRRTDALRMLDTDKTTAPSILRSEEGGVALFDRLDPDTTARSTSANCGAMSAKEWPPPIRS